MDIAYARFVKWFGAPVPIDGKLTSHAEVGCLGVASIQIRGSIVRIIFDDKPTIILPLSKIYYAEEQEY